MDLDIVCFKTGRLLRARGGFEPVPSPGWHVNLDGVLYRVARVVSKPADEGHYCPPTVYVVREEDR